MDRADLGLKLKQFYLLESYQVNLFGDQIPSLPDEHAIRVFGRMVERERHHVHYVTERLEAYGFDIPHPTDDAAGFAGFISAKAVSLLPVEERYRINAEVEAMACEHYEKFITAVKDDQPLTDMLWHNLVDEEFHKHWFEGNLRSQGKS